MTPFAETLPPGILADLHSAGRRRRLPVGSVVLAQAGDPADVVLIVDGQAKIVAEQPDGRSVVLQLVGPGDLVGEMSALDGLPRSAAVVALTQLDVLVTPVDRFNALVDRHPEMLRSLVGLLVDRLRSADRRQLEMGTTDGVGRICGRMSELADRFGSVDPTDGNAVRFESPLNQGEIAAWAGMSREGVVKALAALRRLGWLDNDGGDFRVLDRAALRRRAQG